MVIRLTVVQAANTKHKNVYVAPKPDAAFCLTEDRLGDDKITEFVIVLTMVDGQAYSRRGSPDILYCDHGAPSVRMGWNWTEMGCKNAYDKANKEERKPRDKGKSYKL